ncbi:MAG: prepilin-type N-terminal cleavage/methylation domain-containing protein [Methylacidiphilales bacterium]|nr:prepilin-type N-terminal cleavage/methylation domain-containing protein [Candidatus Methylacidiphilales bacterium]
MIRTSASTQGQSPGDQGFTLVELMAAIAVLAILAVLLAQVAVLTSQATTATSRRLDATGQARVVFDRIASDLAARPRRPDLGMNFSITSGTNSSLQFYSQVDGYSGTRQLATVGYMITTSNTNASGYPQLDRGATGLNYPTSSTSINGATFPQFLQIPSSSSPFNTLPASGDYDVLSGEVFQLGCCYLLNTGALSTTSSYSSTYTYSDVAGLVVAVAVLDSQGRQLITPSQLTQIATDLNSAPSSSTADPITSWYAAINTPGSFPNIPAAVVQNIRVYERTFYVP